MCIPIWGRAKHSISIHYHSSKWFINNSALFRIRGEKQVVIHLDALYVPDGSPEGKERRLEWMISFACVGKKTKLHFLPGGKGTDSWKCIKETDYTTNVIQKAPISITPPTFSVALCACDVPRSNSLGSLTPADLEGHGVRSLLVASLIL